ncbi:AfsR family transcriptional regulator [Streptomyces rectiverticillatus]|uniref:AfsR/SARP family transcriptional regulator n=1 Tax=Streptomyces rectiverticillatus TaxID=173860 RepID=UPI0015C2FEAF|nr:AfsR/SARP family transcriptional regulator [Streptomyces rectiverticillatus]QLE70354.1 AfsR family transcriptional regulator [Streptomyces rectiverticillatus]
MRFQVLGPLRIADGPEVVVLPPSKPTILLASLLLRPDAVVPSDFLRQAIWGDDEPSSAKAALHTCVLRLRKTFIKYGIAEAVIESVPGGYRVVVEDGALDLVRFRELRAGARAAQDPETELCLLREALALWQGAPLSNVPSDFLRRGELPGLVEERLSVVERACDIELLLGRCGQALVELWAVSRAHPGHERFREQLIEALYRSGRKADALAEYREVKRYLREELGVDPGPGLQRLELGILRGDVLGSPPIAAPVRESARTGRDVAGGDPGAGPAEVTTPPLSPTSAPVSGPPLPLPPTLPTLPITAVSSFTGRAAESAAIAARLTADRSGPALVVVSGAPGIGKTALALHVSQLVGHHFPDGRFAVRMTRTDGTPRTSAEVAAELQGMAATGAARACGADRRVLLILDDVTDPALVRPLLPTGTGSAAVLTSRFGLAGLVAAHGGWATRLDALAEAESCRLLSAALGDDRAGAEPEAVRELAAACGHFPLALRIAAARLLTRPRLAVADCLAWLREDPMRRLSLPDDPRMSVPSVLSGALQRLDPRLAEAFLRVGGASPAPLSVTDAAGLLGIPPVPAEEILERLADAGLLEEEPAGRFRMHELLRTFARCATGYQDDSLALPSRQ